MAEAVLEQQAWIIHFSRATESRLIQIMIGHPACIPWASSCHFLVNYWEEIASSGVALAREVLMVHDAQKRSPARHLVH